MKMVYKVYSGKKLLLTSCGHSVPFDMALEGIERIKEIQMEYPESWSGIRYIKNRTGIRYTSFNTKFNCMTTEKLYIIND